MCFKMIYNFFSHSKSLIFFQTAETGRNFGYFGKIALIKSRNRNIFQYLNKIYICDKFTFQQCIICLCYFHHSQMNGGGGGGGWSSPRTFSVLYSAKVCIMIQTYEMTKLRFWIKEEMYASSS